MIAAALAGLAGLGWVYVVSPVFSFFLGRNYHQIGPCLLTLALFLSLSFYPGDLQEREGGETPRENKKKVK